VRHGDPSRTGRRLACIALHGIGDLDQDFLGFEWLGLRGERERGENAGLSILPNSG
jgi:hypothetical protein